MSEVSPPLKKTVRDIDILKADDIVEDMPPAANISDENLSTEKAEMIEQEEKGNGVFKIVHLSDECLEKILFELNIIDLTNVAEANVRLASIAESVFAQVHQNHRLFFKSTGDIIQIPEWHPLIKSVYAIPIPILENMFKHFGKYIKRLKVFHSMVSFIAKPNYNLFKPIAEHCSDILEELECFGATAYSVLRHTSRIFPRVEKLIATEIITHMSTVDNLNKMFPNLRILEFHNVCHPFESFALERHFPHLEHFGIFTFPYGKFNATYLPIIKRFVDLNPQLKSLSMYDMKLALNEFSLETMPNIEKLEIGGRHIYPKPPFNFSNLKSLKLIYSTENETNDIEWHSLPPQLEHLEIIGFNLNDKSVDLITQCTNLRSFTFTMFELCDLKYVERIASNLSNIEEVNIISRFKENLSNTNAFDSTLIYIQKCAKLRKATAAIQIEKSDSKYKGQKFTQKNKWLESYGGKLKKSLIFDWWRWPIRDEIRTIEYLKGWQSGPVFSVSMIKSI